MNIDSVRLAVLCAVIAAAVLLDLRLRKIPNRLVIAGALVAIGTSLLPGSIGLSQSVGGLAIGLAMLLPMYVVRAMGAGDVKLMAAVGAFLGMNATFIAALLTFCAGGLLALVYSASAGTLRQTGSNLKTFIYHTAVRAAGGGMPDAGDMPVGGARMPYSLAIAGGVGFYLAARFYSTGAFA